jgi:hypothetical protein
MADMTDATRAGGASLYEILADGRRVQGGLARAEADAALRALRATVPVAAWRVRYTAREQREAA